MTRRMTRIAVAVARALAVAVARALAVAVARALAVAVARALAMAVAGGRAAVARAVGGVVSQLHRPRGSRWGYEAEVADAVLAGTVVLDVDRIVSRQNRGGGEAEGCRHRRNCRQSKNSSEGKERDGSENVTGVHGVSP